MIHNLFQSAEIRWFWPEHTQWDALLAWFTRQGQLELVPETAAYTPQPDAVPFVKQEQPRTDAYLRLPNCEMVGVKQRQGRLEVKALVAGPRPFSAGGAVGRLDQWVKWSLAPSEVIAQTLETDLRQAGSWRWVEKRRITQTYAFTTDGLAAVSPDAWLEAGCNVELTLLRVESDTSAWITFGFEAFGPSSQLAPALDDVACFFFALHGSAPATLAADNSFSYPAWLAALDG